MHLKRQKVPKKWPVYRKGTKYIVRPKFDIQKGIPILIVLRDILGIAQNRKEVKKIIHSKNLLVNKKIAINEKNGLALFDIITLVPEKKNYRVELSKRGKFDIKELQEEKTDTKISKIINKRTLKGGRIQLNLGDGRNFISEIKCNVNDSVLIRLKEKKIEKCLPLKKGARVLIFAGKHTGEEGIIEEINPKRKMVELNIDKKRVNALIKQLMVIE
jgi:small subunit ribosomal protein S4e